MIWRVITLVALGMTSGVFGLWMADRNPPARLLARSVETPSVRPGEVLRVRYVVDRFKQCATHIDRVLFDGARTRFPLPDEDYAGGPGPLGTQDYAIVIRIPEEAVAGTAEVLSTTTYRCNPLHHAWPVRGDTASVTFMIVTP